MRCTPSHNERKQYMKRKMRQLLEMLKPKPNRPKTATSNEVEMEKERRRGIVG